MITFALHKKMKFFIKDFFSKCNQIRSLMRIRSHLLKKSIMENFLFCRLKEVLKKISTPSRLSLSKPCLLFFVSIFFFSELKVTAFLLWIEVAWARGFFSLSLRITFPNFFQKLDDVRIIKGPLCCLSNPPDKIFSIFESVRPCFSGV